jgi:hypothetical protein
MITTKSTSSPLMADTTASLSCSSAGSASSANGSPIVMGWHLPSEEQLQDVSVATSRGTLPRFESGSHVHLKKNDSDVEEEEDKEEHVQNVVKRNDAIVMQCLQKNQNLRKTQDQHLHRVVHMIGTMDSIISEMNNLYRHLGGKEHKIDNACANKEQEQKEEQELTTPQQAAAAASPPSPKRIFFSQRDNGEEEDQQLLRITRENESFDASDAAVASAAERRSILFRGAPPALSPPQFIMGNTVAPTTSPTSTGSAEGPSQFLRKQSSSSFLPPAHKDSVSNGLAESQALAPQKQTLHAKSQPTALLPQQPPKTTTATTHTAPIPNVVVSRAILLESLDNGGSHNDNDVHTFPPPPIALAEQQSPQTDDYNQVEQLFLLASAKKQSAQTIEIKQVEQLLLDSAEIRSPQAVDCNQVEEFFQNDDADDDVKEENLFLSVKQDQPSPPQTAATAAEEHDQEKSAFKAAPEQRLVDDHKEEEDDIDQWRMVGTMAASLSSSWSSLEKAAPAPEQQSLVSDDDDNDEDGDNELWRPAVTMASSLSAASSVLSFTTANSDVLKTKSCSSNSNISNEDNYEDAIMVSTRTSEEITQQDDEYDDNINYVEAIITTRGLPTTPTSIERNMLKEKNEKNDEKRTSSSTMFRMMAALLILVLFLLIACVIMAIFLVDLASSSTDEQQPLFGDNLNPPPPSPVNDETGSIPAPIVPTITPTQRPNHHPQRFLLLRGPQRLS